MNKRAMIIGVSVGAVVVGMIVITLIVVSTIRDEAEKTRSAMSQTLPDSIDRALELAKGDGQELTGDVSGAASKVLNDIHDILRQLPAPSRSEKGDGKSQSTQPSTSRKPAANPKGEKQPADDKSAESLLNPAGLVGELFKTGRDASRALDQALQELIGLDDDDERQIGTELHAMIKSQQPVVINPVLSEKIRRLAAPFLSATKQKTIDYTFTVLNDPEINAFAHLGGYVYINRGLLEMIDNDAELQFVIGHEIAHVDLKHCVEQMTYQARAGQVAGEAGAGIVQLGYDAVARGYSEDREFEADAWAYSKMGSSQPAAIAFLGKLAKVESGAAEPTKPDGVVATTIHEVENHFRTHPHSSARIQALKKIH